jgi:tRNA nucleotidyltransferase (CCA-adding enzyme)
MEKHLKQLPQDLLSLIYTSGDIAGRLGFRAYLVGGFVRDLILGVKNFDLDIAVEGDGILFAEALAEKLKAKIISHRRFGTATVTVKPHLKLDIATTRKEFYPEPGSLPIVNKGSIKDDLFRRDFTINTLVIAINKDNFGQLLDLFKGKSDIRARKVRVLHNLSFIDDPTRILRAVRFQKRYDFQIEPNTLKRLKEAVKLKMLFAVEPQRLRDELILMLKENEPLKALKRLEELAGLGFINPALKLSVKTEKLLGSCREQVRWFKSKFAQHRHLDSWLVYLAGLLSGLDLEVVRAVCARFVFRKGETKRILEFFLLRAKLLSKLSRPGLRPSSVFHLLEPLSYEVIILLKASAENKFAHANMENFFHAYNGTAISLRGHDLKGLGIAPGPHYQKIFRRVLNAKLNGKVKTAQEELDFVKKLKTPDSVARFRKESLNG